MRRDFAWALEELRAGMRLARSAWAKGVFVTLQLGYPNGIAINKNTAEAIGEPEGTIQRFQPYFMLRSADGAFVPWTASTTDLLAEDWQRFERPSTETVQPAEAVTDESVSEGWVDDAEAHAIDGKIDGAPVDPIDELAGS